MDTRRWTSFSVWIKITPQPVGWENSGHPARSRWKGHSPWGSRKGRGSGIRRACCCQQMEPTGQEQTTPLHPTGSISLWSVTWSPKHEWAPSKTSDSGDFKRGRLMLNCGSCHRNNDFRDYSHLQTTTTTPRLFFKDYPHSNSTPL